MITYSDFEQVDIRVGRVVAVEEFPAARIPSYKLKVDFGDEIGIKKSCAQLTANYSTTELEGRLVAAVVNFPPRQIGPAMSEVLVLGFPDERGEPVLVEPNHGVPLGGKLY